MRREHRGSRALRPRVRVLPCPRHCLRRVRFTGEHDLSRVAKLECACSPLSRGWPNLKGAAGERDLSRVARFEGHSGTPLPWASHRPCSASPSILPQGRLSAARTPVLRPVAEDGLPEVPSPRPPRSACSFVLSCHPERSEAESKDLSALSGKFIFCSNTPSRIKIK